MFHPITSFVSLVECVPANTSTFCSVSGSQFCIEVSTNNGNVSFAISCVLLDRLVHFLDVMVRILRVEEVYTHQFNALAVDNDCGGDGAFVDVFGVNNSLPPLLVQHNSNAGDVSPIFLLCLVSTFHSIIFRPIGSLRSRIPFLRFFHLSALISYFL